MSECELTNSRGGTYSHARPQRLESDAHHPLAEVAELVDALA